MFAVRLGKRWAPTLAGALAGALAAAGPGIAAASTVAPVGAPPNYVFPDGSAGFAFKTQGGVINPGLLVGFNPQPDPTGVPPTLVDLSNPEQAEFSNDQVGAYTLEIALTGFGSGVIATPPAPNADGRTSFEATLDGHVFDVTLAFGPGPVYPGSWVGFNPQPDPPGGVVGVDFQFTVDPWMDLSIQEDGTQMRLGPVPEPATWAMLIPGVAMIGFAARRRVQASALPA